MRERNFVDREFIWSIAGRKRKEKKGGGKGQEEEWREKRKGKK